MKKYVNKLCGKNIKCNQCSEYTGYAGDDCDYVSDKWSRQTYRVCFAIIIIGIIGVIIPATFLIYDIIKHIVG